MKIGEALKKMIELEKTSQRQLAMKLGVTTSAIGNVIQANNIRMDKLVRITNILGYDIVLVPRSGADKKERSFTITDADVGKWSH